MKLLRKTALALMCILLGGTLAEAGQQKRVVFIRAELGSVPFSCSEEYLDSTLQLAAGYFNSQFDPEEITVSFELGPLVSLTGTYTNETAHLAVEEACRLSNSQINFRNYDTDGDGTADCVGVIFSGEEVWPQYHWLSKKNITLRLDHTLIDGYIAIGETIYGNPLRIGPICHEYGHALGLQDLYDTDGEGSGGLAPGLWGSTALMDKGDHNDSTRTPAGLNAIDFDLLGLGTRDTLQAGEYTLLPFSESHEYLYYPTDNASEYFLFECRKPSGRDAFIGGMGLLVYHIDRSLARAGYSSYYGITLRAYERWDRNEVNARPDHQCADLVEAFPDADTVTAVFFPYGESQTFCSDGEPAFRSWNGSQARYALKDIRVGADSTVSFSVIEPITLVRQTAFQSSAILNWKIDESLLDEIDSCTVVLWTDPEEPIVQTAMPSADGSLTLTPNDLAGGTEYSTLTTVYTPGAVYSLSGSFRTMVIDSRNTLPFIFLNGAPRNKDGSFQPDAQFPLYVFNANDAEEIRWYFGGRRISADQENMFTVPSDGELRAEVFWPDGTVDVIVKEITVR